VPPAVGRSGRAMSGARSKPPPTRYPKAEPGLEDAGAPHPGRASHL